MCPTKLNISLMMYIYKTFSQEAISKAAAIVNLGESDSLSI